MWSDPKMTALITQILTQLCIERLEDFILIEMVSLERMSTMGIIWWVIISGARSVYYSACHSSGNRIAVFSWCILDCSSTLELAASEALIGHTPDNHRRDRSRNTRDASKQRTIWFPSCYMHEFFCSRSSIHTVFDLYKREETITDWPSTMLRTFDPSQWFFAHYNGKKSCNRGNCSQSEMISYKRYRVCGSTQRGDIHVEHQCQ